MPAFMRYRLTSTDGLQQHELRAGVQLIVGRAPSSDIAIFDPTISRRHAELQVDDSGLRVRDLGSSNGTFHNGERLEDEEPVTIAPGDTITFGKVAFRVQPAGPTTVHSPSGGLVAPAEELGNGHKRPSATIVRQMPVRDSQGLAALGTSDPRISTAPSAAATLEDKSEQKLATLLEVSKGLGKSVDIDALLEKIVRYAYQILEVDRVAILLCEDGQELVPKIARDKRGSEQPRAVPQSIARKVVEDKVAILSDNAGEDSRFGGQSILMQQIRSAICCPLVGSEDRVLGVLYVDNVTTTHRFSEHDLEYLIAFAGIAAAGIENQQFLQRIQKEMLARENLTRYFAPQVAERIAGSREAARLGGDKRPVAVLFSDIRGFTALSETMNPDDMASLLSEYFTEMVECVFRHDGTLDKFMGDAVMAQWGAPIAGGNDADRALQAALDMMRALKKLNAKWRTEGRPQLQHGIAVNYGEAFAGNIGSERRLEFTVIGDTVNTAYRLCSAAEAGQILITEEMRQALASPPRLTACPPMELKGKSQLIPVYCVVL
ncbi:MAG TPA: adenylate/guanylate cyclase domain-containing protein [Gemmatimonadaceae bacterium]|jgi:adenylate cyclase|nr:adenylate/guanylate cyclase domain-containing protein [Gemmatimonadaceae bacterium]